MVALATKSDSPPNALQPKLVDAIHLRWATGPGIGFPWHGFYLYRRISTGKQERCLRPLLTDLPPGSISGTQWASGIGTVASDRPLATREDFPPTNAVELDLDGRGYLEFLPLQKAFVVKVQVGFRADPHLPDRFLQFATSRPAVVPNPYERLGFTIAVTAADGTSNAVNEIVENGAAGNYGSALLLTGQTVIAIDGAADMVELALTGRGKILVSGRDGSGAEVAGQLLSPADAPVRRYRVAGQALGEITVTSGESALLQSIFAQGTGLTQLTELTLTAYSLDRPVVETTIAGKPGEIATATLRADAVDRVRVKSGPASLIDLCWSNVVDNAVRQWQPLTGITQPIALPVRHPDYPASGNLPTDVDASRAEALARITYGDPAPWKVPFDDLHEQCLKLVAGGPAIPMSSPARATSYPVEQDPGDTSTPPTVPSQQPLQLALLAALHPAVAEMEGLAFSDRTAVEGNTYDYLILADNAGTAGHDADKVLSMLQSQGFTNLDGFIVFERQLEKADPLPPPSDARAYALPGSTRPGTLDELQDASCNAGLRWYLPTVSSILLPDSPVLYHPWRFDYGTDDPSAPADAEKFVPLAPDDPVLIVASMLSLTGIERPSDWPPFPIYGFDNGVDEGWYGYCVSSIDIFGRHSALGPPARWFEWAPRPEPAPWYYLDPPADAQVHPFAIDLLEKVAPPPPTGIEAFALDPADPFVQRDAAYTAWFASLSPGEQASVVGLRARWRWTAAHMRQAPDAQEFRLYYQGGRLNSLLGRTTTIAAAGAAETTVGTDIANAQPADAYVGCSLKLGPSTYSVLGSGAGTPLELRVSNLGPQHDVRPPPNARCEINIPNTSPLFVNYAGAHAWAERYYVVGFDEHVTVGVDDGGRPLRSYEAFLPAPGDSFRDGLPLEPDRAEPIAFAAIGVTAADGRPHSPDDPKWDAGRYSGRAGNESAVGPPALVFRVLREAPDPPVAPPDSEKVFATRADYHGTSYYSFRWVPQPHLTGHVHRAMDDTVFGVDWSFRPRPPLTADDHGVFPPEDVEPRWNQAKRAEVAAELNALNAFPQTSDGKAQAAAAYRALSNDALRVLASLPRNEAAFAQITVAPLDPDDPAVANRVGPDNPPDFVVDPSLRMFLDALDGRSSNRFFYRACYLDGAQNRSALGVSGPPVWLPNVVAPKPPTLTKALAGAADPHQPGDSKITLRWASNREHDLAEYRVYRAFAPDDARSLRTMQLVHQDAVPAGDPLLRPAENTWTDAGVPALRWISYCLTAVDGDGNESPPSRVITARAYDESLPPVPPLTLDWLPSPPNRARASWTAATETRLERRAPSELIWDNASDWLPAGSHAVEDGVDEQFSWRYRIRARKATGAIAVGPDVLLLRK